MSLYLRNDRRRARKRLLIATVVVAVLFIFDMVSGGALRWLARGVSSSVWGIGSAALGSGFFSSRRALQAENETLKQELSRLEVEAVGLEALESENRELRGIVHIAEGVSGVTAPIISSVRSSPYGTFIVGAGSADGISAGSVVMAGGQGGFVIGQIAEADEHISLVEEVFAPGASAEGSVGGAELIFEGQGGGNARAEAPRAISIAEGDSVTSAMFGGRLIGVVGAVSSDSASAYKSIYVRTPVSLSELQFVYVLEK